MKKLFILRHAKSAYPKDADDHARPLDKRGEADCKTLARYMDAHNLLPQKILCSDALRTVSTIKNVLREIGVDIEIIFTPKLYLATPGEILKVISYVDDSIGSLMIVCHNPGAEQLAKFLIGGGNAEAMDKIRIKYPTAALACFSLDTETWQEMGPGSGYLEEFVTPSRD